MTDASEIILMHMLDKLLDGTYQLHDTLPTEMALAEQFDVSRMSAHFAMRVLVEHGVVKRAKRRGTVVCRDVDAPLARQLRGLCSKHVHVIAQPEKPPMLHWNQATVHNLEAFLARDAYTASHQTLPDPLTRESFAAFLEELTREGSAALVLMLNSEATRFCSQNTDLLFQYHRNVYIFDRGDTPPERWPFQVVSLDPFGEGVLAGEYMYRLGYDNILFWEHSETVTYWSSERLRGVRMGLQRCSDGKLEPEHWHLKNDEDIRQACGRLRRSDRFSGIVAANDRQASELVDRARELGLAAPKDFGLISFDNDPTLHAYNLTTVAPPVDRVAKVIAQLVTGGILPNEDGATIHMNIPSKIIERATCSRREEEQRAAVSC
jgi:DNA-binding LacI/PurR family transcriptional regulator